MTDEPHAHLVYLRPAGLLLVKKPQADWRQLQEEYEEYMASLGPWNLVEICDHFALDYGEDDSRWPFTRQAIRRFMESSTAHVLE